MKLQILIIFLSIFIVGSFVPLIEAKSIEEIYQEKLSTIKEDDAEGYYKLGLWCKQNKLFDKAQSQFEKVITLNPEHEKARKELGYIKYNDTWVTNEEKEYLINKKKGLVKYGDKWVSPDVMESLREKDRKFLGWDFDYKIQTKHFLIYLSTTEEDAVFLGKFFESLYDVFVQYFGGYFKIPANHPLLKMQIFKNREEFLRDCPVPPPEWGDGFYSLKRFCCYFYYNEKFLSKCIHEPIHQLCNEVLKVNFPAWVNEGLACYFAATKIRDKKMLLGEIDITYAYPGKEFKKYKNKLGDLKNVLLVSTKEWFQLQEPHIPYITAWSFTHFLFHYKDGKYKKDFLTYMQQVKNGNADISIFEKIVGNLDDLKKEWLEYVKNLKT
jgi:tetratricopeptide (TPR) repeat protein